MRFSMLNPAHQTYALFNLLRVYYYIFQSWTYIEEFINIVD